MMVIRSLAYRRICHLLLISLLLLMRLLYLRRPIGRHLLGVFPLLRAPLLLDLLQLLGRRLLLSRRLRQILLLLLPCRLGIEPLLYDKAPGSGSGEGCGRVVAGRVVAGPVVAANLCTPRGLNLLHLLCFVLPLFSALLRSPRCQAVSEED